MTWEKTAVSHLPEPRSASELKRLRAYEGLAVAVIVIAAVLVLGSTIAIALSSSLVDVAHALAPGP
jgi:hypothetical protein